MLSKVERRFPVPFGTRSEEHEVSIPEYIQSTILHADNFSSNIFSTHQCQEVFLFRIGLLKMEGLLKIQKRKECIN